ncbi:DMT family transporter [Massilia arenosa]|uniref:DMT family transporter n=1 Tax=Zemynaea arenosa TaxID=2561931 RepID=A0A4Y9S5T4_9BURK|nr:DMT family transporter [Massilia arenosa]TFW14858.1 DMT family transporter [Massilia arenosa]
MTTTTATSLPAAPARPLGVYLRLAATAMFWGGTFIAGRTVAHVLPPIVAALLRFGVAAALLLLIVWRKEGGLPRLSRQQVLATAALGLTGIFLYNLCFFGALGRIPAGRAALFIALNPIVTALAAALFLRERLSGRKWAGIALAFFGAAIVITRGDFAGAVHDISQSLGTGELLMLGAISSWAVYTLVGRRALTQLSPVAATTYAALWGLLFLAVGAVPQLGQIDWTQVGWTAYASVGYLGAFGTVIGFVWYYEGVKALGASRAAVFNNLVPVFGVTFAALLLGEPVLLSMVLGGAVAVAGVTLTNR